MEKIILSLITINIFLPDVNCCYKWNDHMARSSVDRTVFLRPTDESSALQASITIENEYKEVITQVTNGLKLFGAVPILGNVIATVAALITFITSVFPVSDNTKSEHLKQFWKNVEKVTDRRMLIDKNSVIKAKLRNVESNLESIKTSISSAEDSLYSDHILYSQVSAAVDNGFNSLDELLGYFSEDGSVLREFPLQVSPILLKMSRLYETYIPISSTLNPSTLKQRGEKLMCKLWTILNQFQTMCLLGRLKLIEKFDYKDDIGHIARRPILAAFYEVFEMAYDQNGYGSGNATLNCILKTKEKCTFGEGFYHPRNKIEDPFNNFCIWAHTNQRMECAKDYFGELRHFYDLEFDPVKNSIQKSYRCSNDSQIDWNNKNNQPGVAEIIVIAAEFSWASNYDPFSKPDAYVKVFANDEVLGKTSVKENDLAPEWMQSFKTGQITNYHKLKVTFEVWDDDGGDDYLIKKGDFVFKNPERGKSGIFEAFELKLNYWSQEKMEALIKWIPASN